MSQDEKKKEPVFIEEEYIDTGNFPTIGCAFSLLVIFAWAFLKSIL